MRLSGLKLSLGEHAMNISRNLSPQPLSKPLHRQSESAPQELQPEVPGESYEPGSQEKEPLSSRILAGAIVGVASAIPLLGGALNIDSIRANERLGFEADNPALKLVSAGLNFAGTAAFMAGAAPLAIAGFALSALTGIASAEL
jgi:hypothetical protein